MLLSYQHNSTQRHNPEDLNFVSFLFTGADENHFYDVYRFAMGWKIWVRLPDGAVFFLFATAFKPSLGPTQPPIQWISESLYTLL
jgi:hypothetical protein